MVQDIQSPAKEKYYIRQSHHDLLDYALAESEKGAITNILVKGPQGCGKSTMPAQFAAMNNRPLITVEMGLFSEANQIFGSMILENGNTFFRKGMFTRGITTPKCVVHIQEINRPESDKTLNAMFSVLDETQRKLYIDDADQEFKVAPGVVFFASLNEGYEFVGTMPLDEALEDRFALKMQLDYLKESEETDLLSERADIDFETALGIVTVANSLRKNTQSPIHVSTRSVIEMGKMTKFGIHPADAIRAVIAQDDDTVESVLATIHFSGLSKLDSLAGKGEEHVIYGQPKNVVKYLPLDDGPDEDAYYDAKADWYATAEQLELQRLRDQSPGNW